MKSWIPDKSRLFLGMIFDGESNGEINFLRCRWFRLGGRGYFAIFQWCRLECCCMRGILVSWVFFVDRFEFRALKSCHLMVANWIFMKIESFKFFFKCGRSWPLTCLEMLVGPRWREFQCLAATRCCAALICSILSFAWCEALSVGEAFSEKQRSNKKWAPEVVIDNFNYWKFEFQTNAGYF